MECWVLNAVFHYSITPLFRSVVKENPSACWWRGFVAGRFTSSLLRCDSGEQIILTPLDEQKNVGLIFDLL